MSSIKDESIDMILCDLPYGVTRNKVDVQIPFEPLWKEYSRVIKENAAIVLFGQGLFYVDLVNSKRDWFRYDLVWDKELVTGFLNSKRMPLRVHEQVAVFYQKTPTYNPQFTFGKKNHSQGSLYKEKELKNQNYGKINPVENRKNYSKLKYPKSIIKFRKPHPSSSVHPTEKSIECLEWLIKTYTNENEIVLDNTAGSGTTGIACLNTNRKYILIEKDEQFYNIAKNRIDEMKKQTKLKV